MINRTGAVLLMGVGLITVRRAQGVVRLRQGRGGRQEGQAVRRAKGV